MPSKADLVRSCTAAVAGQARSHSGEADLALAVIGQALQDLVGVDADAKRDSVDFFFRCEGRPFMDYLGLNMVWVGQLALQLEREVLCAVVQPEAQVQAG